MKKSIFHWQSHFHKLGHFCYSAFTSFKASMAPYLAGLNFLVGNSSVSIKDIFDVLLKTLATGIQISYQNLSFHFLKIICKMSVFCGKTWKRNRHVRNQKVGRKENSIINYLFKLACLSQTSRYVYIQDTWLFGNTAAHWGEQPLKAKAHENLWWEEWGLRHPLVNHHCHIAMTGLSWQGPAKTLRFAGFAPT